MRPAGRMFDTPVLYLNLICAIFICALKYLCSFHFFRQFYVFFSLHQSSKLSTYRTKPLGLLCSGFEPGFYVNSVFDLSCLVSPYLFSAFGRLLCLRSLVN